MFLCADTALLDVDCPKCLSVTPLTEQEAHDGSYDMENEEAFPIFGQPNYYDELFSRFLSTLDFELVWNKDGWSLVDLQGANLGDIESDRFFTAGDIIERLDTYISDYFLHDEEWGNYDSCEEALEKYPDHPCKNVLELIMYHYDKVNLANAYQA